jgi:hypothetical protein
MGDIFLLDFYSSLSMSQLLCCWEHFPINSEDAVNVCDLAMALLFPSAFMKDCTSVLHVEAVFPFVSMCKFKRHMGELCCM